MSAYDEMYLDDADGTSEDKDDTNEGLVDDENEDGLEDNDDLMTHEDEFGDGRDL